MVGMIANLAKVPAWGKIVFIIITAIVVIIILRSELKVFFSKVLKKIKDGSK